MAGYSRALRVLLPLSFAVSQFKCYPSIWGTSFRMYLFPSFTCCMRSMVLHTHWPFVLCCRLGWSAPIQTSTSSSRWRETLRSWRTKAGSMWSTAGRLCCRLPPTFLWTISCKVGHTPRGGTAPGTGGSRVTFYSVSAASDSSVNLADEVRSFTQATIINQSLANAGFNVMKVQLATTKSSATAHQVCSWYSIA